MQLTSVGFRAMPSQRPAVAARTKEPETAPSLKPETRRPEFSAEQLKTLTEVRNPGATTLQDRLDLARSLTDVLSQEDAVRSARFLVELSSGQSGCKYLGNDVEIDVNYRGRPLDQATRELRDMLAWIKSSRAHRSNWGEAGQAELALGVATCVLADEPEKAELFKSLLHDYGNPYTAYQLTQKLARLPEEYRGPTRDSIERHYSFDEKGQPRPWGPPQNWLKSSLRLLFMASLLEPGQPFSEAQEAAAILGPRLDALQSRESKVFSSYKASDESFDRARDYRDPHETPLQAVARQLDLIDSLAAKGFKVVDQRHSISYLSHRLPHWRELLPGQSADQILRGVVREVVATDLPPERMGPLVSQLDERMQPGETPRSCLDRLARMHGQLEKRFAGYGQKALDEAFRSSLNLPAATPLLLADVADRHAQRNPVEDLNEFGFFSRALELSKQGMPADAIVTALELERATTGSCSGLGQLKANLNWLEREGTLTPERRAEVESGLTGWVTAFRLAGAPDPSRGLVDALKENPLQDLATAVRGCKEGDLMGHLEQPEQREASATALSEVLRLGRRLGYQQGPLLDMLRAAMRQAGVEGALALPGLLAELKPDQQLPSQEDLVDLVRSTVAREAADHDQASLSIKERLERAARSFYLTGSYNGMRQACDRLQVWQDSGRLRRDVPFSELKDALERHLVQLRVLGTPPEKTVEQALAALQASEYGGEGQVCQTLGMIGEKLAVGAVPVKIRRSR